MHWILLFALTAPGGLNLLDGESPHLRLTSLQSHEHVVLHSYRGTRGGLAHAFAEFEADDQGSVEVDRAVPVRGTYEGVDPMGLLWSGEKSDGPPVKARDVLFRLERTAEKPTDLLIHLTDGNENVSVQEINQPDLNGVFARPKDSGSPLPSIILLHGSEGGSMEAARASAIRFANLGYAVFALNYFAFYGDNKLPRGLMSIPVETLEKARNWMARQSNIATEHVAVYGVSKGAELALVAAANFPWIDRVIGCVPSSVVWAGFGRAPAANEVPSSWTVAGRSLPFITYDRYEDSLQNRISAAGVHLRSLEKASPQDRAAARIPIEMTSAKILLFAAAKDHVWPSAMMTREIEATMLSAGKSGQLNTLIFQNASHFICGLGNEITRINPVTKPEGDNPAGAADARASARTWAETRRFLAAKHLTGGPTVLEDESAHMRITKLVPREHVTLHSYRPARAFKPGDYAGTPVLAHAFAEFEANAQGEIDVDTAIPIKGTYQGADPLGLLWSGEKSLEKDPQVKDKDVLFRLKRASNQTEDLLIHITDGSENLDFTEVNQADLNGVFARPKNASAKLPSIILLHGAEGGSAAAARENATRFARLGYAAFALNYFAYYGENKLPRAMMKIPVENIETARKWLSDQPSVDTSRVAVYGLSRGAELALVAASHFPWIHRVAACVPSSVVWEGFGRTPVESAWTIRNEPLPFINRDNPEDTSVSPATIHRRGLEKASPEQRAQARIPIEKSKATVLLLGAAMDQVWPSGMMTRELESTLNQAGKPVRSFVLEGSHFICGEGTDMTRINPIAKTEGANATPADDAHAAAKAWAETKRFFDTKN